MTAGAGMDDLERMYRHLVRTIRANFAPFLSQPFEVGELYQTILPYRLHRRELGLDTNQDYEATLLELLSGARGYLVVDDKMRDVLSAELASSNPDPAIIRDFSSAHVALAPEPLRRLEQEARMSGSHGMSSATPRDSQSSLARTSGQVSTIPRASGATPAGMDAVRRRTAKPITIAPTGENCPFCRGDLPPGRQISFCPHCGQDLTVVHCPACASELDRGWKFCVSCGRSAQDL